MRFEVWFSGHKTPDGKPNPLLAHSAWSVKEVGTTDEIRQCAEIEIMQEAYAGTKFRTDRAPFGYLAVVCKEVVTFNTDAGVLMRFMGAEEHASR